MMTAIGLGVGIAALGANAASAQEAKADIAPEYQYVPDLFSDEIPRGETVRTRQRPELDALGIHIGNFFLFPSLGNSISYNDNVFATDTDEKSDFVHVISPTLSLQSDWNNHSLNVQAGGRIGTYFDESDENYQDAFGRVGGHVDVTRSTNLAATAGIQREHEERSDPNSIAGAAEPTVFYTYSGRLEGNHRFNRVTVSAGGDVRYIDYDNVDAIGGGTIDNQDQDRTEIRPGVKVAYEFSPGYSAFVRGEGTFIRYDETTDDSGFKRDSQGYDLVGGASLDLTGLLFGDFFAGVRQRFFDDSRFDSITGPVVGSNLTWIPTGLTTVILEVNSQIIESPNLTSSGYTSTGVGVTVDHELLRNLILSAGGAFRYDDFEGITRTDKFYSGTVGADYLMNRYLTLGARYRYQHRDSDISGNDYSRNLVTVSLTAKY
jgi:hypothetical protein